MVTLIPTWNTTLTWASSYETTLNFHYTALITLEVYIDFYISVQFQDFKLSACDPQNIFHSCIWRQAYNSARWVLTNFLNYAIFIERYLAILDDIGSLRHRPNYPVTEAICRSYTGGVTGIACQLSPLDL